MHICVLASGSKGNAIYIADEHTAILVDAGLSGVEIERRMQRRGLNPQHLQAIVVSHEHSDHLRGVGVLSRRYHLPVYISPLTLAAAPSIGKVYHTQTFNCGHPFNINSLTLHPFSVSHDAADPAGFTIRAGPFKVGLATDLGLVTAIVQHRLQGCQALILEANHDPHMLLTGPYPWELKQRVRGRQGHLSNPETRTLLDTIKHPRLQHVILAHLSEHNNTADKALAEIAPALDNPFSGQFQCRLTAARPDDSTPLFTLQQEF